MNLYLPRFHITDTDDLSPMNALDLSYWNSSGNVMQGDPNILFNYNYYKDMQRYDHYSKKYFYDICNDGQNKIEIFQFNQTKY